MKEKCIHNLTLRLIGGEKTIERYGYAPAAAPNDTSPLVSS
jgi:hypothetical protein